MAAAVGKPRRHKYGVDQSAAGKAARTIQHNGKDVLCGSAAEARRFAQLVQLERAALIDGLVPHPRYPLKAHFPNGSGITVAVYVADSSYYERRDCGIQAQGQVVPRLLSPHRASRGEGRMKPQRVQKLINAWAIKRVYFGTSMHPSDIPGMPMLWPSRAAARHYCRQMPKHNHVIRVQITVVER